MSMISNSNPSSVDMSVELSWVPYLLLKYYTDKKEKKIFLIY